MLRFHGSRDKVSFELVGHNSRLDELQAALLRLELPHLDAWCDGRRAAAAHYAEAGLGELAALPEPVDGCDPAWHLYVIRHERPDALAAAFQARGIGSKAYYRVPLHRQAGDAPVGRRRAARHRGGRAHAPGDPDEPGALPRAGRARSSPPCAMRVWVDLTNSPHVLVLRPVIRALERAGQRVEVTARDFAQTLGLRERLGIAHEAIGRHRGGRLAAKGVGLASRSLALADWARGRRFDVALGHGSNDITVAAKLLGIPSATTFDYEWATVAAHRQLPARAARSSCPTRSRPSGSRRYGADAARSCAATRGSRRSTTSRTSSPTPRCSTSSGSTPAQPIAVVRTPPAVSLYHRFEHPLFAQLLERLREQAQAVVLPRTPEQRAELARAGGFVVPERAVDAQSLVALRRPRRLRRRDDEPRGRRARHAGVDDVRGPPGRGRRAADRRRPAAQARRAPEDVEVRQAGRRRAATRAPTRVRRDPAVLAELLIGRA